MRRQRQPILPNSQTDQTPIRHSVGHSFDSSSASISIEVPDCLAVPGYLSLRDFVDEYLLHNPSRCFLVSQDQQVAGLVTPEEVKRVAQEEWPQTSLQSIMQPINRVPHVPPEMPAVKALELLGRQNINELAVVSQGKLEGIFSRGQVARFLQVQSTPAHR
jgi:predicted transcriptional regulator